MTLVTAKCHYMFQSNEKFNYGIHHGLRGSVSPVLMATQLALSMGNSKI